MTTTRTGFTATIGLIAVTALVGFAALSAALFSGWFTSSVTVSMKTERAGLLTAPGSDVKFHGVVVGRVTALSYDGQVATITMALQPDALASIPNTVSAAVTPTTLFGRKFIDLVPRSDATKFAPLTPGAVIDATHTAIEVDDLFADLLGVLDKVDADKLNDTLYALSTGLQGKGTDLGDLLVTLNKYLSQFNGTLPTLERDIPKFARTSTTFADISPDVMKILDNLPTTQKTLSDNRTQVGVFLLSFTRFGNTGNRLITRSGAPTAWAADGLAPVTSLLSTYSPTYPCFFASLDRNRRYLERAMGGARSGLNAQGTLLAGDPPYRSTRNLPKVAVDNAPSCYGATTAGDTHRPPGHVDFNDGSEAYRQPASLTGATLADFLFGVHK